MRRKTRARIIWFSAICAAVACTAALMFPVFSDFSYLKAGIQNELGAKVKGDVKIVLLPRPMLRAHDVELMRDDFFVSANSVQFPIKISDLFNSKNISVPDKIGMRGGRFIRGDISLSDITGRIATTGFDFEGSFTADGRKYTAVFRRGRTIIENKSLNFRVEADYKLTGNFAEISGNFKGSFPNLEDWMAGFGFSFGEPAARPWAITADFVWDKENLNLTNMNLSTTDALFAGRAKIPHDHNGVESFDLDMIDGNLKYLSDPNLKSKKINVSGSGNFTAFGQAAKRILVQSAPDENGKTFLNLDISNDDFSYRAKGLMKDGLAQNIQLSMYRKNTDDAAAPLSVQCDGFSGRPDLNWKCDKFYVSTTDAKLTGSAVLSPEIFNAEIYEMSGIKSEAELFQKIDERFGANKSIEIQTPLGYKYARQMDGYIMFSGQGDLSDLPFEIDLAKFVPKNLELSGEVFASIEKEDQQLRIGNDEAKLVLTRFGDKTAFYLATNDFAKIAAKMFPGLQTNFIRPNLQFAFSGNFFDGKFDEITMIIGSQKFTGRGADGSAEFKTDLIDFDALINPEFIDNFEQARFLNQDPVLALFGIKNIDLILTADNMILGGKSYQNFIYSKTGDAQKISANSGDTGTLLAEIVRRGAAEFEVSVRAGRWPISGFFDEKAGMDIKDSIMSADVFVATYGLTANDVWNNMEGSADLVFDGGILRGANTGIIRSNDLTRGNLADFLSAAFAPAAQMKIENLHLPIKISGREISSSAPFNLTAVSGQIAGLLKIGAGGYSAKISVDFRGANPNPRAIEMQIDNGYANFDLDNAQRAIDPDYIKARLNAKNEAAN